MMLLVLSMGLLFVYFRLIRHSERYQIITGKDFKPRRLDLGAWRYLTCALSLLLVFLITGLPFLIMLYASLMPRLGAGRNDLGELSKSAGGLELFGDTALEQHAARRGDSLGGHALGCCD
jgi:ABC-type Fe3+ transport system permease subunit